jgi:hypothetical protein
MPPICFSSSANAFCTAALQRPRCYGSLPTVLFLVPINNRMMLLDGAMNAQAQHDHRTWDSLHRLRILALAAAAFCALIAMHA